MGLGDMLKRIAKLGILPVLGAISAAYGFVSAARDVRAWGLPAFAWVALGWVIFAAVPIVLAYGQWKDNKRLRADFDAQTKQVEQLSQDNIGNDPTLTEARKQHFEDLCQLVQKWKDSLVIETSDPFGKYDLVFAHYFTTEDWALSTVFRKSFHCYIDQGGEVSVWFPVEREPLFSCLKEHLDGDQLWKAHEELKTRLAEGIKKASLLKGLEDITVTEAPGLAYKIVDHLDIALAKRVFAGKCRACPGYRSTHPQ